MTEPLAAAHVVVSALIILWNTLRAGRIATVRTTPRLFAALSGLAGLLLVPALLVRLAAANALYARSVEAIAWLWPLAIGLFVAQALYALLRRMSHPLVAGSILAYNGVLAVTALTEHALMMGAAPPEPAMFLLAAHRAAFSLAATPAALGSTAYVMLPIIAPAFPARWGVSIATRAAVAGLAALWVGLTAAELRVGRRAVLSYPALARQQMQERPEGNFAVGAALFPSLASLPPPLVIRNDLAIADSILADAVSIVLEPAATRAPVLDSLRRAFEARRRGGMLLVVTLGWERSPGDVFRRRRLDVEERVAAVDRIARRLSPDYLLPAQEPYGAAARAVGTLHPDRWRAYYAATASAAETANPRVRIAYAASSFDARDSALYAWAASPQSPVDAVGFILRPTHRGGAALASRMATAERWMAASGSTKEHWVFGVSGLPLVHGEASQRQAIWGVLAWATRVERIRGVIVADATDYTRASGLRSSLGRLRPALFEAQRAAKLVREAAQAESVGVPVTR